MMNSKQVFAEARHAGMKLWVPKDKDVVKVSTRIPLREEFKEALTAHRDEIMRDLLMAQAQDFLQERFIRGTRNQAIPAECYKRVNEAYASGTIPELREALRDYVRAGLAEYKAAREERQKSHSDV